VSQNLSTRFNYSDIQGSAGKNSSYICRYFSWIDIDSNPRSYKREIRLTLGRKNWPEILFGKIITYIKF